MLRDIINFLVARGVKKDMAIEQSRIGLNVFVMNWIREWFLGAYGGVKYDRIHDQNKNEIKRLPKITRIFSWTWGDMSQAKAMLALWAEKHPKNWVSSRQGTREWPIDIGSRWSNLIGTTVHSQYAGRGPSRWEFSDGGRSNGHWSIGDGSKRMVWYPCGCVVTTTVS